MREFKEDLLFDESESTLRPKTLKEYVGQSDLKEMLNVFIQTALQRRETLDRGVRCRDG